MGINIQVQFCLQKPWAASLEGEASRETDGAVLRALGNGQAEGKRALNGELVGQCNAEVRPARFDDPAHRFKLERVEDDRVTGDTYGAGTASTAMPTARKTRV